METPLGFSIWREEDDFCTPGQVAKFSDGPAISLLHKAKNFVNDNNKNLADVKFKIQLEEGIQSVYTHYRHFFIIFREYESLS